MTDADYEYRGLKASTWDLHRGDTSTWTDRTFYFDIVQQFGAPVLDIGCGTGRILLDFLQLGIDIDGIDNSPDMLAICREKAVKLGIVPTLYLQTMQRLDLPRRYRTILVPSSSLQILTNLADAQEAMRRFFDHLLPGGAFLTPFGFDWREGEPLEHDWEIAFEKVRPEDGAIVRRRGRTWHTPQQQLWHDESIFEVDRDGKVVQSETIRCSPSGRWYTPQQAIELYRAAGFEDVQVLGGFEHRPMREDERLFCVLGRRR
jgi:SAM-dependent methyltransferase